jgi:hypothetical protein
LFQMYAEIVSFLLLKLKMAVHLIKIQSKNNQAICLLKMCCRNEQKNKKKSHNTNTVLKKFKYLGFMNHQNTVAKDHMIKWETEIHYAD